MTEHNRYGPLFDLVGVGIGPFNLSLAALSQNAPELRTLFLEAKPVFSWHPGLLLEGTVLQVPFLADLVTMADPTSRWSFLNYLREHDRMFPFFFSERFHIPRREYDHYCRWVADHLPCCRFDARVTSLEWDDDAETFTITHRSASGTTSRVRARLVVLGVGTQPVVPEALRPFLTPAHAGRVLHSEDYLTHREHLATFDDVTVIGAGQSGAEVTLDLLRRQDHGLPAAGGPDRQDHVDDRAADGPGGADPVAHQADGPGGAAEGPFVRWLARTPAFAPMEYSKIGLEHFTPDYVRYFRGLPEARRDRLVQDQWQLYKGVSEETLADIHDELYELTIGGRPPRAALHPGVTVVGVRADPDGPGTGYALTCRHSEQEALFVIRTSAIVSATGYAAVRPPFLDAMAKLVDWDDRGRYRVDGSYRVALDPRVQGSLFVQNAEMHTHGVGAPDLTLGAWRAATILNAAAGRTVVPVPERAAWTTFGVPESHGPESHRPGPAGPHRPEPARSSGPGPAEAGRPGPRRPEPGSAESAVPLGGSPSAPGSGRGAQGPSSGAWNAGPDRLPGPRRPRATRSAGVYAEDREGDGDGDEDGPAISVPEAPDSADPAAARAGFAHPGVPRTAYAAGGGPTPGDTGGRSEPTATGSSPSMTGTTSPARDVPALPSGCRAAEGCPADCPYRDRAYGQRPYNCPYNEPPYHHFPGQTHDG